MTLEPEQMLIDDLRVAAVNEQQDPPQSDREWILLEEAPANAPGFWSPREAPVFQRSQSQN